MIITTAVLGNTVLFRASFLDEDGAAMSPTTVRIRASQRKVTTNAEMELDGGVFTYRLDTGRFRNGDLDWAIDASDGVRKIASIGTITLTVNLAQQI